MLVKNKHFRTVWFKKNTLFLIDQNKLPFRFKILKSDDYRKTCIAIKDMTVRGAGAIGVTAGYAMAQAFLQAPKKNFNLYVEKAKKEIEATRPTARNLFHHVDYVYKNAILQNNPAVAALNLADELAEKNVDDCKKIGRFGSEIIYNNMNIATHCNAGWLAFVDYGSALAPIYNAYDENRNIFVWVDETRPRLQGSRLTAWELYQQGVPHKIIADNAAAFLMQKKKIDMYIVGADRISANGDTANKIGTLEKAIAAKYYGIPFYVAAPTSTFDISLDSGNDINIEIRDDNEILYAPSNTAKSGKILISNKGSSGYNPSFDVTPAELISGIITEFGIIKPTVADISKLRLE